MHTHASPPRRINQDAFCRRRQCPKPHHHMQSASNPLHLDFYAEMSVQRFDQCALPSLLQAADAPHMPVVTAVLQ